MPRTAVKVQGAPNKTHWTLASDDQNLAKSDRKALTLITTMQVTPPYSDQQETPLPRYESFDGSQFRLDRSDSGSWRPTGGDISGEYAENGYNTLHGEHGSYPKGLNTRVRSRNQDAVGQHLLYETAMLDSQSYEILDIDEVDALKKEYSRLNAKIDAATRKLALETKVKEAAHNLQRLYTPAIKARPDTPQSPGDAPKRIKGTLLGHRGRTDSIGSIAPSFHQADDELSVSVKKVDELNETIKSLLERRQQVEGKLLRHTAAVLAEQSAKILSQPALPKGILPHGHTVETPKQERTSSAYTPDDFDGIRDILSGASPKQSRAKPVDVQKMEEDHARQIANVQSQLEQLNQQLRSVVEDAARTLGISTAPEPDLVDFDSAPDVRLDKRFELLQEKVQLLSHEQQEVRAHTKRVQESAHMTQTAVEDQLETINQRLHTTLLLGADMQDIESLREPPRATGHGYQQQLQYLDDSMQRMEGLLRQHVDELRKARDVGTGASRAIEEADGRAATHAKKLDEYEATLGGLWEILQSNSTLRQSRMVDGPDDSPAQSPGLPLREDFSLQAFSARVQHLFDRAQSAKEQQDILRRQIQQQRELNGKSDAEKDRQLTDLQGKHEQLALEHSAVQEELTKVMAQHAQAVSEASQSRLELVNSMNEFENLKRAVDARQQERDEMVQQLQMHQGDAAQLQARIEELEDQVAELQNDIRLAHAEHDARAREAEDRHGDLSEQLASATAAREAAEQRHADLQKHVDTQVAEAVNARQVAEQRHTDTQNEMVALESELVRLTTELTMAKAELEGAYGSRAERAKEAQAADVSGLSVRHKQTQDELQRLQAEHERLRDQHQSLTDEYDALKDTHHAVLVQMESLQTKSISPERIKNLESELAEMTDAFQDLTRESIELEKERHQLEDLIDGLRDRCETLENQLSDEKVRWLGLKSPSGGTTDGNGPAPAVRETTSMSVMRQEFKKMMRESRAEGVRILRAEQEQRRHLEAELRRLRQANGPLAKASSHQQANGIGNILSTTNNPQSTLPST